MGQKLMMHKWGCIKEILIDAYVNDNLSMAKVAEELGCTPAAVLKLLRKFNIPSKKCSDYPQYKRTEKHRQLTSRINKGKKIPERVKAILRENGKRYKGANNPMWNGGVKHRVDGYIQIMAPNHPYANKNGYVMEHRLIMEKHIGRFLDAEEVVHHINGIRNDNRLENLKLMTFREHARLHMNERLHAKERWANN